MPHVRPATADDIPALVALMAEFYAEAGLSLPADAAARTFAALVRAPEMARGAVCFTSWPQAATARP